MDDINDFEQKGELETFDMDTALRLPCTVCELKFISRGGLDKHMKIAHSGAVVGEVAEGINQDILAGRACGAGKKEVVTVAVTPTTGLKRTGGEVVSPMGAKKAKTSSPTSSSSPVQALPTGIQRPKIFSSSLTKTKKASIPVPLVKIAARQTKTPCNLCEKPCKSGRGLSMHMSTSHKCGYCDNLFANLVEHENVHETEACTECEQKFVTAASLQSHMKRAHQIKCDSCEENFYNEDDMKQHTREEHEEECEHCYERFATALSLLEPHQLMVHGIKPRVVKTSAGGPLEDGSPFAEAPASMPPSERQTESEFNDGPGDFGGPGSPGGLSSGGSRGASPAPLAMVNVKSTSMPDPGERRFQCQRCDKQFGTRVQLKHHMNIHLGLKPYPCKECGKSFTQPTHLSVHRRTHNGFKPYMCSICEKTFAIASNMRKHAAIHDRDGTEHQIPSEATARSGVGSMAQDGAQQATEVETTTLLHNGEESFALAPVEASAMKGPFRTKRKRKLIVDEVKAISGKEMKGQLSDTGDTVTTFDLAPPTKRLMHWKETGGVEKLFALPGRLLQSRYIHDDHSANLIVRASDAESFDMLGDNGAEPDLALEQVPGAKEFQEPLPPAAKETRKGRKRKNAEEEAPVESAYSKRQAELAMAVEEGTDMDIVVKACTEQSDEVNSNENVSIVESIENIKNCLGKFLDDKETEDSALETLAMPASLLCCLCNDTCCSVEDLGSHLRNTHGVKKENLGELINKTMQEQSNDQEEIDDIEIVEVSDEDEDEDEVFFVSEHEGVCMTADEKEVFRKCFSKKNS